MATFNVGASWISLLSSFYIVISIYTTGWGYFAFQQIIEADMISDFAVGNSKRATGYIVFLGFFDVKRNFWWFDCQRCRHSVVSIHLFDACCEHLDEDCYYYPWRHDWDVGSERQCRGAYSPL